MRYAGRFVHRPRENPHGEVIQGDFPAIISWDLWSRCVAIRRQNRRERLVAGDRRVTAYSLTGLLVCGSCGDTVRGDTAGAKGRRRYHCRRRRTAALCSEHQVIAEKLEADVLSWLQAVRVEPEWQEVYDTERQRLRARGRPQSRTQRVRAIEAKIERLRVSWESGARTDEPEYRHDVAALRQELENARSVVEPEIQKQAATLRSLADGWELMRPDQRKRLLQTIFCELVMRDSALESATPRPDWLPYFESVCQPWARRDSNPHALSSTGP